jgi:uncharacterized protein
MSTDDDTTQPTPGTDRHMNRRTVLKAAGIGAAALGVTAVAGTAIADAAEERQGGPDNWYTSNRVTKQPVTFDNQYKMRVAGNLFTPKAARPNGGYPALVIGHPMGGVKEQGGNLYATKLAEQGYATLALDISFWGGSEGQPRQAVLPDMYAEDFNAAVDYLGTRDFINRDRIGAVGICGSSSFAIAAAKLDPRLRAVTTVSMYDMGAVNRNGLENAQDLAARKKVLAEAAEQRYVEFQGGSVVWTTGTPSKLTSSSTDIDREFYDFYRTSRGEFTPAGATPETTTHRATTGEVKFMNFYPFDDIETISPRPLLFISGDQAHSREFSEDAYKRAAEPKELHWVRGAGHVDLYDRTDLIPFDKITQFFNQHLAA